MSKVKIKKVSKIDRENPSEMNHEILYEDENGEEAGVCLVGIDPFEKDESGEERLIKEVRQNIIDRKNPNPNGKETKKVKIKKYDNMEVEV